MPFKFLIDTGNGDRVISNAGWRGGPRQRDVILSARECTPKDLWLEVQTTVRQVETEDACLILDETIQEKEYTDENDVMCWHFDRC